MAATRIIYTTDVKKHFYVFFYKSLKNVFCAFYFINVFIYIFHDFYFLMLFCAFLMSCFLFLLKH